VPQPKKTGSSTRSRRSAKPRSKPKPKPAPPPATNALESLARGIVLTRDRIDQTLDDAVRRGRITRADAEDLAATLIGSGRRGAQELRAELEQLLGRGKRRTTESTDVIVRQVDRARRVARIPPSFPILGYDDLTAAQVAERVSDLSPPELRKVRDYERRNANRKSVLTAIERALR
jgi:hypothetical protein